jgi:hypothetical protein
MGSAAEAGIRFERLSTKQTVHRRHHAADARVLDAVGNAWLYSVSACAMIDDWTRRAGQRTEEPPG